MLIRPILIYLNSHVIDPKGKNIDAIKFVHE